MHKEREREKEKEGVTNLCDFKILKAFGSIPKTKHVLHGHTNKDLDLAIKCSYSVDRG